MKAKPIIDKEKCAKCGLCASVCACGSLQMVGESIEVVNVDDCEWCTMCEIVCPNQAISCPFEIVFGE